MEICLVRWNILCGIKEVYHVICNVPTIPEGALSVRRYSTNLGMFLSSFEMHRFELYQCGPRCLMPGVQPRVLLVRLLFDFIAVYPFCPR